MKWNKLECCIFFDHVHGFEVRGAVGVRGERMEGCGGLFWIWFDEECLFLVRSNNKAKHCCMHCMSWLERVYLHTRKSSMMTDRWPPPACVYQTWYEVSRFRSIHQNTFCFFGFENRLKSARLFFPTRQNSSVWPGFCLLSAHSVRYKVFPILGDGTVRPRHTYLHTYCT